MHGWPVLGHPISKGMLAASLAAETDTYQLLQYCSILQSPLLATLVLLAITPSAMHFYLNHFIPTNSSPRNFGFIEAGNNLLQGRNPTGRESHS